MREFLGVIMQNKKTPYERNKESIARNRIKSRENGYKRFEMTMITPDLYEAFITYRADNDYSNAEALEGLLALAKYY